MMNPHQPDQSTDTFPIIPVLVLFASIVVITVLAGALAPQSQTVAVEPTSAYVMPTLIVSTNTPTPIPPTATLTPEPQAVASGLDPSMVSAGGAIYQSICVACHGFNARGISGLGKTLIDSEFVNGMTDAELHAFLVAGRGIQDPLNTTGVAMPAKGGNPNLTDADLDNVVAYIRNLNTPQIAGAPTIVPTIRPTASGPTPVPTEFVAPSLGDSSGAPAIEETETPDLFLTSGQVAYNRSCAGCHGADGQGVQFLGSSLAESALLTERNGIALLEFLTKEQPPVDPRVAFPHPYRGGYPLLSDEQLLNIIAYLHTLAE
jgi:mono/diheme cytochrome c family protein